MKSSTLTGLSRYTRLFSCMTNKGSFDMDRAWWSVSTDAMIWSNLPAKPPRVTMASTWKTGSIWDELCGNVVYSGYRKRNEKRKTKPHMSYFSGESVFRKTHILIDNCFQVSLESVALLVDESYKSARLPTWSQLFPYLEFITTFEHFATVKCL